VAGWPTARRYARAVFELALEHDAVDQWSNDLDLMAEAMGDEDFFGLLEAPQVPDRVKYQGIDTVMIGSSQLGRNLASVLVDHRSVRFAGAIREEFRALADAHNGVARAEVVTAVAMEDSERERVSQLLGEMVGANVETTERVDPEIIGGIIARVGDHLIDGSVRTRLADMRAALAAPPVDMRRDS
jgi:F-type H+-transporting ATPase subunit delta